MMLLLPSSAKRLPAVRRGYRDGPMAVCENCAGEEDEELVAVWPAGGTGDQPELWCEACRDRFPHEPAEDDEG